MRNGEKIYWCKRLNELNAEVDLYDKAQSFTLRPQTVFSAIGMTAQPKNGFTDRLDSGETTKSDYRVLATPYQYWYGKFKIGDVFYIDGVKPINEEWNGQNANYYVEFVGNQENAIELSLKQIKNN